jgi:hypothetical protein
MMIPFYQYRYDDRKAPMSVLFSLKDRWKGMRELALKLGVIDAIKQIDELSAIPRVEELQKLTS